LLLLYARERGNVCSGKLEEQIDKAKLRDHEFEESMDKRSKREVSQGHDREKRMDTNRNGNIERRAISRHATWNKREDE
jgi:hypothetical protein